jgi:SAM-dependent methyltransferase
MVARHEVEMAYRLIMGREAGNEQAIEGHMRSSATLDDLRRVFLASDEFRERVVPTMPPGKPLNWLPIHVDTQVSSHQLNEMIARVERNFRHMGETEPHWSVISAEKFKSANIKQTRAEFFASGEGVVHDFLFAAARCGAGVNSAGTCFELGCGLGRSTIWLAKKFAKVIGADVSAPHLELGRQAMAEFQCPNVDLVQVDKIGMLEKLPKFDAFFSIIVLQHNPPPLIRHMLQIILQKLNPGGLAYFQVPTYGLNYEFKIDAYLSNDVQLGVPEMHVLPQTEIFALAKASGCRVLEVREDGASGWRFISNRLLIQKE